MYCAIKVDELHKDEFALASGTQVKSQNCTLLDNVQK